VILIQGCLTWLTSAACSFQFPERFIFVENLTKFLQVMKTPLISANILDLKKILTDFKNYSQKTISGRLTTGKS
jgi:hypothetical protein